jgi:beta-phosphoglucomutase family hydrolase
MNSSTFLVTEVRENTFSNRMPCAIIFDMDGTLVETTEADFKAWQRVFRDHGRELSFEDYFPLLGRKSQDVVQHVLNLKGEEAQENMRRKMYYFEEFVEDNSLAILPGAGQFLGELKAAGIPMGLATSSRQPKMRLVLEKTGLFPFFNTIVTGEMVEKGKPSPDIFLLTAQRMGIQPSDCVVLEDAVHGITAARTAGMKSVAIVSTHEASQLNEAHLVINSYSELSLEILKGLFESE